jgi:ubiquinone/menaquinone biosynthesis C-methylase UbiE
MSSFVFMKLLETRASRYDVGMRLLSLGQIGEVYREVAKQVEPGCQVLEIGCGTGGVTAELLARGCTVTAVDRSRQMLTVAEAKLASAVADGNLLLRPLPITAVDRTFGTEAFDHVVCCLVLSELTATEVDFALDACARLLRPDGTVVIADEVAPRGRLRRWAYRATRAPMALVAYLLTQTTTHALDGIADKLTSRGLVGVESVRLSGGSFEIVRGRKPACRLQTQT